MSDVTEGSAINFDYEEDDVPLAALPFAYRLDKALVKLGVSVQPYQPAIAGMSIRPDGFVQLVVRKDVPEMLADTIGERFGPSVQFGELVVPTRGCVCIGYEKANNVWVRRLADYYVGRDSMIQRWDVLVRAK